MEEVIIKISEMHRSAPSPWQWENMNPKPMITCVKYNLSINDVLFPVSY